MKHAQVVGVLVVGALIALAGCVEVKVREAPDGSVPCLSDGACPSEQPVCDLSAKVCVQCLPLARTESCGGTTPVCSQERICQGCSANADLARRRASTL